MSDSLLRVERLHRRFGARTVVSNVSFDVKRGEIFGVLGPNGAGKTTTMECIAGALAPTSGRVSVGGKDPFTDRAFARSHIGYQLQAAALPPALRVHEAMTLFASFYEQPADIDLLLQAVDLAAHRRQSFAKLSGGQRQRLSIALALVGSPDLIILDELTTGIDPRGRRDMWELVRSVRASGVTVLLVTHALDEAEVLCDRIAVIDQGRVRFLGTPDQLIGRPMRSGSSAIEGARRLEDAYLQLLEPDEEGWA